MRYIKVIGFIISLMFLMLFVACAGNSGTDDVRISITPSLSLRVGETGTLNVTRQNTADFTLPAGMASGSGCVKCGNNAVICTPTAAATYSITVTATADTTKKATSTVTVTPALPGDNDPIITPPSAPLNLTAEPGNAQVVLSWSAPDNDGGSAIIRYEVSSNNGSTWINVSTNTSYTFAGLTNGTSYTFRVRAVNDAGNGADDTVTATPVASISTPTAPKNLTAEPGNGQVKLSWSAPDNDGGSAIIRYEISFNGSPWDISTTNTSVTFYYLMNEISYTFRVRAINDTGNGAVAEITSTPIADVVPGPNLTEKLFWLQTNAGSGMDFIVDVDKNEVIAPTSLFYSDRKDITITLRSIGSTRNISLASNGSMFSVESGVTLVLDNITLQGRSSNESSLVHVSEGGSLIMNTGAMITGNDDGRRFIIRPNGGGVSVLGTFIMNGGTISANSAADGGGVFVDESGTFTLYGGNISGNATPVRSIVDGRESVIPFGAGGGVSVRGGTFIMDGGTISNNTADRGGGVYTNSGTVTINNGTIFANTAYDGGGINVNFEGNLTMNGGIISANSARFGGGVVCSYTFHMAGGTISGNTASSYGGGVFIGSESTFNKTGGTVTGYASDTVSGNVVRDTYGIVLNNRGHAINANGWDINNIEYFETRKETTAGPGVNLWWDNTGNSPTYSGAWDYPVNAGRP